MTKKCDVYMPSGLFFGFDALKMPNILSILVYAPVRREYACVRDVDERHTVEALIVFVSRVEFAIGTHIVVVIGKTHIRVGDAVIALYEIVGDVGKAFAVEAALQSVDYAAELVVMREIACRAVAVMPSGIHLVRKHSERKDIVFSDDLAYFDVCAVHRAESDGAV